MKKFFAGVMFAVCVMIFVGCTPKDECILKNYVYDDEGIVSIYKINDNSYRMEEKLMKSTLKDMSWTGTIKEFNVQMTVDRAALEEWLEIEDISVQL